MNGIFILNTPLQTVVQIADILIDDMDSEVAESGDNVKLKLRNIEEEDISPGEWWYEALLKYDIFEMNY